MVATFKTGDELWERNRRPKDSALSKQFKNGASAKSLSQSGIVVASDSGSRKVRIVSLLASATEIVCALGAGEMLVGRSHECWVRRLPACSDPAFEVSVSSGQIDQEVPDKARRARLTRDHCELKVDG